MYKTFHFESLDSTNTYLKDNYETYDDMSFVSANIQTNGKGRSGRKWNSDNSNLLFSLLIKDELLITKYKQISILTAYSILQVLRELGINDLSIKWPNDIYVKDSKICGILLEGISKDKFECLIVGVGLNVNQVLFEDDYLICPTSIKNELYKDINIEMIKQRVYDTLSYNLDKLKQGYEFYNDIKKFDYLVNKEVYALINNHKQKVTVLGINEDYSLKIKFDNSIRDIETGEISFHI